MLISHGSIRIPTIGIMAPVIIGTTSRERSNIIRFHALQSKFFPLVFFYHHDVFMVSGAPLSCLAQLPAMYASIEPGMLFLLSIVLCLCITPFF